MSIKNKKLMGVKTILQHYQSYCDLISKHFVSLPGTWMAPRRVVLDYFSIFTTSRGPSLLIRVGLLRPPNISLSSSHFVFSPRENLIENSRRGFDWKNYDYKGSSSWKNLGIESLIQFTGVALLWVLSYILVNNTLEQSFYGTKS